MPRFITLGEIILCLLFQVYYVKLLALHCSNCRPKYYRTVSKIPPLLMT